MKLSGGNVDFQSDHDVYWPALEALTDKCRKEHKERWERAGKLIGEREAYLRGGEEKSVGAETEEPKVDQVDGLVQEVAKLETKETEAPSAAVQPAAAETKPAEEKKE